MSPSEKAKELVDRYCKEVFSGPYKATDFSNICAKQCAIICCDEVINEYETRIIYSSYDYDRSMWQSNQDEWKEIKTEIQKL